MGLIVTRSALAVAFVFGLAANVDAQDIGTSGRNTNVGTASAEFLLLGAGARGMALQSGFSAIVNDVEALYYNPAGLPLMDGPQAMFTVMPYFAETSYIWGGYAFPFANGQYAFGVSIGRFGFSDQPVYTAEDPTGESGRTYGVGETYLGISFAHAFIDRFTGGITIKYISDQLAASKAHGFAVDVGTNYHTEVGGQPISMAFSIQNLGSTLQHTGTGLDISTFPEPTQPGTPTPALDPSPGQFETHPFEIPVSFRVSLAYEPLTLESGQLTVLGSFMQRNSAFPGFGFGGEYEWSPAGSPVSAALRASYTAQLDNRLTSGEEDRFAGRTSASGVGMDGLVLGGGIAMDVRGYNARVDYAYRHFGILGAVNVFSVALGW